MIRTIAGASIAFAAVLLAAPAFARAPSSDVQVNHPGASDDEAFVLVHHRRVPQSDDFIVIADLRLPTLGDLARERWYQVHRRYDSGRGRREKIRT